VDGVEGEAPSNLGVRRSSVRLVEGVEDELHVVRRLPSEAIVKAASTSNVFFGTAPSAFAIWDMLTMRWGSGWHATAILP